MFPDPAELPQLVQAAAQGPWGGPTYRCRIACIAGRSCFTWGQPASAQRSSRYVLRVRSRLRAYPPRLHASGRAPCHQRSGQEMVPLVTTVLATVIGLIFRAVRGEAAGKP